MFLATGEAILGTQRYLSVNKRMISAGKREAFNLPSPPNPGNYHFNLPAAPGTVISFTHYRLFEVNIGDINFLLLNLFIGSKKFVPHPSVGVVRCLA